MTKARKFVDFFVENAVHGDERGPGAVEELVERCLKMAGEEGVTQSDIDAEFPNLAEHLRFMIEIKNAGEKGGPSKI